MDHPRPLRHAADREAVARGDGRLRAGIGGEDRGGSVVAAVGGERSGGSVDAGEELGHRQPRPDHAGREHDHLLGAEAEQRRDTSGGPARVLLAPGPVAALATPALTTTARGSASSRWRRETTTGAAWTRLVVQSAHPTAGSTAWTSATSGFPDGRIPAATPEATNPEAAVTDIRRAPRRAAGPEVSPSP